MYIKNIYGCLKNTILKVPHLETGLQMVDGQVMSSKSAVFGSPYSNLVSLTQKSQHKCWIL